MQRLFALLLLLVACGPARGDSATTLVSQNFSVTITTGNTFQTLRPLNQNYNSLTIQNNQTSGDNCWVEVTGLVASGNTLSTSVTTGNGTTTAQQASILLTPSSSYQRYFPYLPRGPIVVTCATTGDSIYVDTQ
jgi:hypothetical protein